MEDEIVFNIEDLSLSEATVEEIVKTNQEIPGEEIVKVVAETTKELTDEEKEKAAALEKEKVVDDKNKTPEEKTITPASDPDKSSVFSGFATLLNEEGVFDFTEDELKDIKTSGDLIKYVKEHFDKIKYDGLSEHQQRYLKAVEAGIPEKEFEVIEKQLSSLESISPETLNGDERSDLQTRFDVIAFNFIEKGFDKDRAVKMANQSIKAGMDKEDAKEALVELIKSKTDAYNKAITEKKEQKLVTIQELEKAVNSKDKVLKDYKLIDADKKEIFNLLSTKVDTDESGRDLNAIDKWRKDNGVDAEIILATLYRATNKFQDLGKIGVKATTNAALELEKRLKQNEQTETVNSELVMNGEFTINV